MRRLPSILYGVTGQSLTVRVPSGRPTAATFSCVRNYGADESVAEFAGLATVSAVNTTLSSAVGPSAADPRVLALTSTAGIVAGGLYELAQEGLRQVHEVLAVGASAIRVRFPLQRDFAAGATFVGTHLTGAVPDAWASDLAHLSDLADTTPDYRVRWSITVGGAVVTMYSFFDLVRADVAHHVELSDLNERAFGLADSLPIEHADDQGRGIIDGAWTAVRAHMISKQIAPSSWRHDEVLDELVVLRALRHLAEGGWAPPGVDRDQYIRTTRENYARFFEEHLLTLQHKTSVDLDAATNPYAPAPHRAIWSK